VVNRQARRQQALAKLLEPVRPLVVLCALLIGLGNR
jgi:hypothetical protein